jgi:hypothetical protein
MRSNTMTNSRSTTFRRGPFRGWHIDITASTVDGRPVRTLVQLATPGIGRVRMMAFHQGGIGFAESVAAMEFGSGVCPMEALAEWMITATREDVEHGNLVPEVREHWSAMLDDADHSRAEWFAEYPDGTVLPFEVVGALIYSRTADELVGAL